MYEYIRKFAAMFIHKDLRVCLRDVQETFEYIKVAKTFGITLVVLSSGSSKNHITYIERRNENIWFRSEQEKTTEDSIQKIRCTYNISIR